MTRFHAYYFDFSGQLREWAFDAASRDAAILLFHARKPGCRIVRLSDAWGTFEGLADTDGGRG